MRAELILLALSSSALASSSSHHHRGFPHFPGAEAHPIHPRPLSRRNYVTEQTKLDAYDFVIAGGGLAGLVIASRLSEDGNKTVLVLESGGTGEDNASIINTPASTYFTSLVGSVNDWGYTTEAQANLQSRSVYWPGGRLLGGSSAINGMYYVRPSQDEINAMRDMIASSAQDKDADVWAWDSFFAAMKKSEQYTAPVDETQKTAGIHFEEGAHGKEGPLHVTYPGYMIPLVTNWLPSLSAAGIASASDGGNGFNVGGFIATLSINPTNWTRSYSKSAYIDPLPPRSNLHIMTSATVTRLITTSSSDGVKATGVEYASSAGAEKFTVNVNKEVILSGGVVGSPHILQLSGIGPKDVVTKAGVESVLDLPGVGAHLQDHMSTGVTWTTTQDTQGTIMKSGSDFSKSPEFNSYVNCAIAYVNSSLLLGDSYDSFKSSVTSSLDSSVSSLALGSDEVKAGYKAIYQVNAEKMFSSDQVGLVELLLSLNTEGIVAVQAALQHPLSQGQLYINSSSVFDKPVIDPGYLTHQADVTIMREGLKLARRIGQTSPLKDILGDEQAPGSSVQSDEDWENWLRGHVSTEYHPSGTCAMLPRSQGGVVDAKLKVYGTSNIRVADSSIYPMNFASHLGAPTYGVAEIASELIHAAYAPSSGSSSGSGTSSNSPSGSSSPASGEKSGAVRTAAGVSVLALGAAVLGMLL